MGHLDKPQASLVRVCKHGEQILFLVSLLSLSENTKICCLCCVLVTQDLRQYFISELSYHSWSIFWKENLLSKNFEKKKKKGKVNVKVKVYKIGTIKTTELR